VRKNTTILKLFFFFSPLACATICRAQVSSAPPVSTGDVEVGAFVGESYGLDKFRPMFGGNVAYGWTRALYPFFETSYLPGIERAYDVRNGTTTRYKVNMTDVHGGIHVRFPIGGSPIVPYAVVGIGVIHFSAATLERYGVNPVTGAPIDLGPLNQAADTSFAVNFGGGFRFFPKERFGIRVEFKAFVPTSAPNGVTRDLVYRFAIGPVFQVR
jgi:hypothetical protein